MPRTGGRSTVPGHRHPARKWPSALGTSTLTVKFVVPGCSSSSTAVTVPRSVRVLPGRDDRRRRAGPDLHDLRGGARQHRVDARDLFDREQLARRRILARIRVDRVDHAVDRRDDRRSRDLAPQLLDAGLRGVGGGPIGLQFRLLHARGRTLAVGARVGLGLGERGLRGADGGGVARDGGALLIDGLRREIALRLERFVALEVGRRAVEVDLRLMQRCLRRADRARVLRVGGTGLRRRAARSAPRLRPPCAGRTRVALANRRSASARAPGPRVRDRPPARRRR